MKHIYKKRCITNTTLMVSCISAILFLLCPIVGVTATTLSKTSFEIKTKETSKTTFINDSKTTFINDSKTTFQGKVTQYVTVLKTSPQVPSMVRLWIDDQEVLELFPEYHLSEGRHSIRISLKQQYSAGFGGAATTQFAEKDSFLVVVIKVLPSDTNNFTIDISSLFKAPKLQYRLGHSYQYGFEVKEDSIQALHWYNLSADQGDSLAMYVLGTMYYTGHGVKRNVTTAAQYYLKAAKANHSEAQLILGRLYEKGEGVSQDLNAAFSWVEHSAFQGNTEALKQLGLYYWHGIGVTPQYDEALRWSQKAAEQEDAEAQNQLAFLLLNDAPEGKANPQESFYWSQQSASQGNVEGQLQLSLLYSKGIGVEQSDEKALYWLEKAAQQNDGSAKRQLAQYYEKGQEGVAPDLELALKWYINAVRAEVSSSQGGLSNEQDHDALSKKIDLDTDVIRVRAKLKNLQN